MFSEHFYRYRPLLNQQIFLQNHLHGFDICVNANAGKERQHLQIMLKSEELALILCVCVCISGIRQNSCSLCLWMTSGILKKCMTTYNP